MTDNGTYDKMQYNHQNPDGSNTTIHYVEDVETGAKSDFKYVNPK